MSRVSTCWPNWSCNNCGNNYAEDTKVVKCKCGGKLVRWQHYEEKRK